MVWPDRILEDTTVENLAGHDVVFLALPHGASAEIAAQLPAGTVVIDAGADHRLEDPAAWEKFYGSRARRNLALRPARTARASGRRWRAPSASPSRAATRRRPCWPSPRASPPACSQADDVVIVAASGTSGAGKAAKVNLIGSEVMGSMSPYGVGGGHRHTPEIEQGLSQAAGAPVTVSFTPTLAPMSRRHPHHGHRQGRAPGRHRRGRCAAPGRRLRRRAVRAPAARGPVARHASPCWDPTTP